MIWWREEIEKKEFGSLLQEKKIKKGSPQKKNQEDIHKEKNLLLSTTVLLLSALSVKWKVAIFYCATRSLMVDP